jgi:hypothetical protein
MLIGLRRQLGLVKFEIATPQLGVQRSRSGKAIAVTMMSVMANALLFFCRRR